MGREALRGFRRGKSGRGVMVLGQHVLDGALMPRIAGRRPRWGGGLSASWEQVPRALQPAPCQQKLGRQNREPERDHQDGRAGQHHHGDAHQHHGAPRRRDHDFA